MRPLQLRKSSRVSIRIPQNLTLLGKSDFGEKLVCARTRHDAFHLSFLGILGVAHFILSLHFCISQQRSIAFPPAVLAEENSLSDRLLEGTSMLREEPSP